MLARFIVHVMATALFATHLVLHQWVVHRGLTGFYLHGLPFLVVYSLTQRAAVKALEDEVPLRVWLPAWCPCGWLKDDITASASPRNVHAQLWPSHASCFCFYLLSALAGCGHLACTCPQDKLPAFFVSAMLDYIKYDMICQMFVVSTFIT